MAFYPQTRFMQHLDTWYGNQQFNFATEKEAQAYLDSIHAGRNDILQTRITETSHRVTQIWFADIQKALPAPVRRGRTSTKAIQWTFHEDRPTRK